MLQMHIWKQFIFFNKKEVVNKWLLSFQNIWFSPSTQMSLKTIYIYKGHMRSVLSKKNKNKKVI